MSTDSDTGTDADAIEARLGELRDEDEQAGELGESFTDATEALDDIRTHALVDDETAAKVELLKNMVRAIQQHDVHAHESIHHERDILHRQLRELKHAEEGGERD